MPPSLRTLLTGFALGLAGAGVVPAAAQQTRPEQTGGAETSSHADVMQFLDSLARQTVSLRLGRLGESPQGRPIPYVVAARPMVDGPGDAHRSGKPILYIQGNIHAGEVEGKEAAQ
ncbi:MAG: M14 family zinc carboxypeptidase, partial [Gemmatimonadota bacterium]|nr:M14 family zinc carboxypeptidase [Gemmatimonadota bacterium]